MASNNGNTTTTLLERLVWVRYENHWWPALLYNNYTELQDSLYDELDMILKAQFAMAILREAHNPTPMKVARLLGRQYLEVVELDLDEDHDDGAVPYAEFYWQLPHVIPKACEKSRWIPKHDHRGREISTPADANAMEQAKELYLDFHRALDQVEDIITSVSQNNFALVPGSEDNKTWFERADDAWHNDLVTSSAPIIVANRSFSSGGWFGSSSDGGSNDDKSPSSVSSSSSRPPRTANQIMDQPVVDPAMDDSGPIFGVMDSIMEVASKSFDAVVKPDVEDSSRLSSKDSQRDETNRAVASAARFIEQKQRQQQQLQRDSRNEGSSGASRSQSSVHQFSRYTPDSSKGGSKKRFQDKYHISIVDDTRRPSSSYSSKRSNTNMKQSKDLLPGIDKNDLDDVVPGMGDAVVKAKGYIDDVVRGGRGKSTTKNTMNINMMQSHRGEKLPSSDSSSKKVDSWLPPKHPGSSSRGRTRARGGSYGKNGVRLPMAGPPPRSEEELDDSNCGSGIFDTLFGGGTNDTTKSKSAALPSSRVRGTGVGMAMRSRQSSGKSRSLSPDSRRRSNPLGSFGTRFSAFQRKSTGGDGIDSTRASIGPPKGSALPRRSSIAADDDDDDSAVRALMFEARQEAEEERRRQRRQNEQKQTIGVGRSSYSKYKKNNYRTNSRHEDATSSGSIVARLSNAVTVDDSSIDSTDRALMYEAYQEREAERSLQQMKLMANSVTKKKNKSSKYDTPTTDVGYDIDTSSIDSERALLFEMKQERIKELRQQRDAAESLLREHQSHRSIPKREDPVPSSSWSFW